VQKATRQHTKEQNRILVLRTIFDRQNMSRAEIARITHLTRTTVSDIVSELIKEGLVREIGLGSSIGGKSPILLSLIDDSRCILSLDLAYNRFSGAVVNLRGQIKEYTTIPINDTNGEEALKVAYEILDQLIKSSKQTLVGIGIGAPGLINTQNGYIINAVNLDWQNLPLGSILTERYHLPVYVLNDCQAAAMGELIYGMQDQTVDNLIVIRAGHGIGAGIIINRKLFQGDNSGAGEIGHVVYMREGGLPCRCGNFGCLETLASVRAVLQRAQLMSETTFSEKSTPITLENLEQAFFAGDNAIRQIVLEAGRYLGMAVANLVGAYNIHHIIFTGEMTRFGEPWLDAIRETMGQYALPKLVQDTIVQIGRLGDKDVMLGASALMASSYQLLFTKN
jgi:N-acetylglucosamine repressor